MASFQCAQCSRPVFLRPRQLPPVSGLCLPCNHKDGERRRAHEAWCTFRDKLLAPPVVDAPNERTLLPAVDLRRL